MSPLQLDELSPAALRHASAPAPSPDLARSSDESQRRVEARVEMSPCLPEWNAIPHSDRQFWHLAKPLNEGENKTRSMPIEACSQIALPDEQILIV